MPNFDEIGVEMGISGERARQIFDRALTKFRRRWGWIMGDPDPTTFEVSGKLGARFEFLEQALDHWWGEYGAPLDYWLMDGWYYIRFPVNFKKPRRRRKKKKGAPVSQSAH